MDKATFQKAYGGVDIKGDQFSFSRVDVFGPDGALKKRGIVRLQGVNDVKLARDGSIYVIEAGTRHGAHNRRAAKLDNKQFTRFNKLGAGCHPDVSGWHPTMWHPTTPPSSASTSIPARRDVWVPDPAMYNVAAVDAAGNGELP